MPTALFGLQYNSRRYKFLYNYYFCKIQNDKQMKNILIIAAVLVISFFTSCGASSEDDGKSVVAVRDSTSKSQADSIAQAMKDSMANLQNSNKK